MSNQIEQIKAEIERWWDERYAKMKKDYKFDSMSGHYLDNETIIALARHFAEWGAEHADKPIYEVSSRGKSAMGDKFYDWLQFGTHAIWDWMVKTDWYKKLNDMSDELIVKVYLGKKHSKK